MAKVIVAVTDCVIGGKVFKPWQIISTAEFFGMRDIDRHGRFEEVDESRLPVSQEMPVAQESGFLNMPQLTPIPCGQSAAQSEGGGNQGPDAFVQGRGQAELAELAAAMFESLPEDVKEALIEHIYNTGKLPKEIADKLPSGSADGALNKVHEFIAYASEKTRVLYHDLLAKLGELRSPSKDTENETQSPENAP